LNTKLVKGIAKPMQESNIRDLHLSSRSGRNKLKNDMNNNK
jgi:hypothetical protein